MARLRRMVCLTLAESVVEALQRAPTRTRSEYVERLIRAYPPPLMGSLDAVAALVRDRHPWVMDADDRSKPRSDLPVYSKRPVSRPEGVYCYDAKRVMDADGHLHPRKEWEDGR